MYSADDLYHRLAACLATRRWWMSSSYHDSRQDSPSALGILAAKTMAKSEPMMCTLVLKQR